MAQKWEYTATYAQIAGLGFGGSTDPSAVWTHKDKETGKSEWDKIVGMGKKGWELISVTPIAADSLHNNHTKYLLYTFKRPLEE